MLTNKRQLSLRFPSGRFLQADKLRKREIPSEFQKWVHRCQMGKNINRLLIDQKFQIPKQCKQSKQNNSYFILLWKPMLLFWLDLIYKNTGDNFQYVVNFFLRLNYQIWEGHFTLTESSYWYYYCTRISLNLSLRTGYKWNGLQTLMRQIGDAWCYSHSQNWFLRGKLCPRRDRWDLLWIC